MADVCYDVPEFTKAQRIALAQKAWENADNSISIRKMAQKYGICHETLRKRINRAASKVEQSQALQLLSVGEEESIVSWIKQLGEWGWPPRVLELRKMAIDLLRAKGAKTELGIY